MMKIRQVFVVVSLCSALGIFAGHTMAREHTAGSGWFTCSTSVICTEYQISDAKDRESFMRRCSNLQTGRQCYERYSQGCEQTAPGRIQIIFGGTKSPAEFRRVCVSNEGKVVEGKGKGHTGRGKSASEPSPITSGEHILWVDDLAGKCVMGKILSTQRDDYRAKKYPGGRPFWIQLSEITNNCNYKVRIKINSNGYGRSLCSAIENSYILGPGESEPEIRNSSDGPIVMYFCAEIADKNHPNYIACPTWVDRSLVRQC